MRKRKGFTLIELLTVIAILAVILLLALPIILNNIKTSKEKSYSNQVSMIVDGAERYALEYREDLKWEETDVKGVLKSTITLRKLSNEGYMDLPVINPKTGLEFDPDETKVIIYKNEDGTHTFEFEGDFKLIVGSKVQTIRQDTKYNDVMVMTDVYGEDAEGNNIKDDITYTCKYNQEVMEKEKCNEILSQETKELGTYYIIYSLTRNNITKTATRTINVVSAETPKIILNPEDGKVDSVRVTILYPEGAKEKKYKREKEDKDYKDYIVSFDVYKNQKITADCKDKNGLNCKSAEAIIKNIKIKAPTITSTIIPTTLVNGYATEQQAKVTYREEKLTGEIFYVKTTKEGTSSIAVTQSCGTSSMPGSCTNITSTKTLAANTWYKVSGNVEVTYNTTSTSESDKIYAVIYDQTAFSDVVEHKLNKIDKSGPDITLLGEVNMSNSSFIYYSISDTESGINDSSVTCKYGETNGTFNKNCNTFNKDVSLITGLVQGKTYYYKICVKDKLNNETCKVGSTKPATIKNPTITFTNTPTTAVNGYYSKTVANVTYDNANISVPEYFVKTTRKGISSIAVTQSCGTSATPGSCTNITSTTTLSANTWYKVSGNLNVTYSETATSTGTIYALTYDGLNYSGATTGTIPKGDATGPAVTLGSPTTKTDRVTIPYTISDGESGLSTTVTCKYGTTSESYTLSGSSVSTTSCTITGLKTNTTYYYQICAKDKLNNQTCKTGSTKPVAMTNPTIGFTNTPTTAVNGYYSSQVAKVTYNGTNITSPQYFVKTTRLGTSNVTVTQSCGTGTVPGSCTNIASTKTLSANTWYKVSGNIEVTYSETATSTGTILAVTYDGTNLSTTASGTIGKIDKNGPTITVGSITTKTDRATIPYTISDSESGVGTTVTCKYGTTSGSYTLNGSNVSTTACTLTGLETDNIYYYQICAKDKLNNQTCKTGIGSGTNGIILQKIVTPTITFTNDPTTPVNGWVKKQIAKVTYNGANITSPQYFVKTTRKGISNISVTQSCGTGTVPGSCTNITSTTTLSANTWYKVSGNLNVTYSETATETGTIYAVTNDGTNLSTTANGTINKIDATTPVAKMVVVNGAGTTISNNGDIGRTNTTTITFECSSPSGVKTYNYYNEGTVKDCTTTTVDTSAGSTTTENCKDITKQFQTATTTPYKFVPTNIGINSSTTTITHYLTCTNNLGVTSAPVGFNTKLVNAPTVSLAKSSVTQTSITVKTTGSGTTPLKYRYSTSSSFSGSYTTSTTYTFSGLTAGKSYTLWVEATDAVGQIATATTTTSTNSQCSGTCGYNGCGTLVSDGNGGCKCSCTSGPSSGGSTGKCTGDSTACLKCIVGLGSCAGYPDDMNASDVSECLKNNTCGGITGDGTCMGNPIYCN